MKKAIHFIFLLLFWVIACQDDNDALIDFSDDEVFSGGENGSTTDLSANAFGAQIKGLNSEEQTDFVVGNSLFRSNWVSAPSSVQSLDGLGPLMNAISCGSCHAKDGRAKPPFTPDEALNGLLFRLSVAGVDANGAPMPHPHYGGQLNDKAILGVEPEAKVRVTYEDLAIVFADGSKTAIRKPKYTFYDEKYGSLDNVLVSPRIGQQVPGLGLLEAIDEAEILKNTDANDSNNDGISGRPNYVWDYEKKAKKLGRFGWKANQPSLRQQTSGAFLGDIGITSNIFPNENLTAFQATFYGSIPSGGTPEIEDLPLRRTTFYLQTLAVPIRRNADDIKVLEGKKIFQQLNCNGCHKAQFTTGNTHKIKVLHNQKIYPYTDLLLHDMGEGLADNRPDYEANGQEWRTPPLWGIGMIKTVNKHTFLLHDGRARNIEEAILWHGGESENSKEAYKKLTQKERAALLSFLESL